jgi:heme exporter protein B
MRDLSKKPSTIRLFWTLLRKDVQIELRGFETLSALLTLALLAGFGLGFAIQISAFDPVQRERLFPACFWTITLLSVIFGSSRQFESELKNRSFAVIALSSVSLELVFFTRTLVLFVLHTCTAFLLWLVLASMLLPTVWTGLISNITTILLACGITASLTTILSPVASYSRLGSLLMPLLSLPLLLPIILMGTELTLLSFEGGVDVSSFSYTLTTFFCISFLGSLVLYRSVVRSP